jgi:hypothetical protein
MHVIDALEELFAGDPSKKQVLEKLRKLGGWATRGGVNGE